MRTDKGNQPHLWLIHTTGQFSIFHKEPTNMLHGHNLLKGLQFRRVSVQFSMYDSHMCIALSHSAFLKTTLHR